MKVRNLFITFVAILVAAFFIRLRSTRLTVTASTPPAADRAPVTATPKPASDADVTKSAQIFNLSDLDQQPIPRFGDPKFPFEMKFNDVPGTFEVGFICDTEGHVRDAHVINSSGSSALDQATVAGVSKWRFKPGMKDGHAVNVRMYCQLFDHPDD